MAAEEAISEIMRLPENCISHVISLTSPADSSEIMRLPENCISHVISLTSPADSCRSAAISTMFHSAADSDTVWEHFLPSDYEEILSRAVNSVEFSSKKELYFRLCRPILIDGKKKSFWLERSTGRKCYTLSARELEIMWRETSEYWKWGHFENSRFPEVAEFLDSCWLDIRGRIDCKILSRRTNYAAYLVFKLDPDTYGFGFPSQNASVRVGSQNSHHEVCLEPGEARRPISHNVPIRTYMLMMAYQQYTEVEETGAGRAPNRRLDGWMEMELGEFFSGDGDDGEAEMVLWETESRQWKSGLIIEGIEVRPK